MSYQQTPAVNSDPETAVTCAVATASWAFDAAHSGPSVANRTLSCLIWSANQSSKLSRLLPQLSDLLTESGHPWEIVVVDTASSDGTAELLRRWSAIPAIRSISVSEQSGDDALLAGLAAARGDGVICLDANLHHTLALIPQMISHWEDGAEVVYALRQGLPETSALNWFGPSVFDSLMGSPKPLEWLEDCAELTLLNRRVVTYLNG